MNPKAKLASLKNSIGRKAKIVLVLWLALVVLIATEAFIIKNSVNTFLKSDNANSITTKTQGVRVDFSGFNKVLKKKEEVLTFKPSSDIQSSPFGLRSVSR